MRELFERMVEQYLAAGLASAEHVAADGSVMLAEADHHQHVEAAETTMWSAMSRKAASNATT